ncbi:hypothetical protein A7K91_23860 [Paenibacillus oryzae]|uniref:Uncharacterized protein n=1 Tax=Paenibacillus oryzae TaxID=1844972 RepID=A0A1A5YC13_9BACL|nr:hypothetical protein [Paenibacillus oryzae]OBR63138.1 hypothetical protein A7K91_23860 [Paenibacillus oryzae]
MNHKNWLIAVVGLMSLAAGWMYLNDGFYFKDLLGMEQGSELAATSFWSKASMGLGAVLLVTLALRSRMKTAINDGQMILLLSFLFVIQLPALGLWTIGFFISGYGSLPGAVLHAVLLLAITLIFVTGKVNYAEDAKPSQ